MFCYFIFEKASLRINNAFIKNLAFIYLNILHRSREIILFNLHLLRCVTALNILTLNTDGEQNYTGMNFSYAILLLMKV